MGGVISIGAPDTPESKKEHERDTEEHAIERNLREWANSGQIHRVRKFHELTAELLAKRAGLELVE